MLVFSQPYERGRFPNNFQDSRATQQVVIKRIIVADTDTSSHVPSAAGHKQRFSVLPVPYHASATAIAQLEETVTPSPPSFKREPASVCTAQLDRV